MAVTFLFLHSALKIATNQYNYMVEIIKGHDLREGREFSSLGKQREWQYSKNTIVVHVSGSIDKWAIF